MDSKMLNRSSNASNRSRSGLSTMRFSRAFRSSSFLVASFSLTGSSRLSISSRRLAIFSRELLALKMVWILL
jgi:hypothetical protein